MNYIKNLLCTLGFVSMFAACTNNPNVNQLLANKETRTAIIDTIANDDKMSREMMNAMMNSRDSMQQHIGVMMEMMRDNPGMMNTMMSNLMEASKKDSNIMIHMYENMMSNQEMMGRMKQRMTVKKDSSGMMMKANSKKSKKKAKTNTKMFTTIKKPN